MRLLYLGHASFWIQNGAGGTLVTDPYQPGAFGALHLKPVDVDADVVTVSHQHLDHNYVQGVGGTPQVISTEGDHQVAGFHITGYPSYHDRSQGRERGSNLMFLIQSDQIRVLHCGDLGHPLTEEDQARIGRVDILLVPVGGTYTISAKIAKDLVHLFRPNIAIPMHYKVAGVQFPIDPVDEFLKFFPNYRRLETSSVELQTPLPEPTEVWVIPPARA